MHLHVRVPYPTNGVVCAALPAGYLHHLELNGLLWLTTLKLSSMGLGGERGPHYSLLEIPGGTEDTNTPTLETSLGTLCCRSRHAIARVMFGFSFMGFIS